MNRTNYLMVVEDAMNPNPKSKDLLNIATTYIPNTFNYGSMMMAENFIFYLKKRIAGVSFYTDASTNIDIERLVVATGVKDVHQLSDISYIKNSTSPKYNKLKRQLIWFKEIRIFPLLLNSNNIHNFIMLGGDNISEYYGSSLGVIKLLISFNALSKENINVFLVGQTIGPFHSWRVPIAKKLLNRDNIYIYTRDPRNYRYVQNALAIKNIMDCADLAFLDLAKQNEKYTSDILNKYALKRDEYITLVTSGLWKHYHQNRDEYIQTWCNIVERLSKNEATAGYKIVLLPHVLKPDPADDRHIIKEIQKRTNVENLIPIYDEMLPSQARHILGNGYLTITGRMHGAISTFQMGKPAISLSYSVKYGGVIGEGLKRDDLIIKADDSKLYTNDLLGEIIEKKVKYIIENYRTLTGEIKTEVIKTKKKAIKQIDDVAEKIMGG